MTDKKCMGFDKCGFYKSASQARREAVGSSEYNGAYLNVIADVIKMIDENQRDYI